MGILDNRVAVITGAAGDLGAHMSRLIAHEGASVVLNDVNAEGVAALAVEIRDSGGRAVADTSDVSTFAGGRALVDHALDEFGTVDALVLLAGFMVLKPLVELTEEDWDGVTTIHLKGTFSVLQSAAPTMIEKGYGRIVTAASSHGTIGDANMAPYCAAKAGIVGLTRAAAIELDQHGICVNSICPGGKDGDFGPISARLAGPAAPNAPLVAYLASEEAGWVNGHIFDVSGSGRVGLYGPLIPQRLIEKAGGYTVEELRTEVPRMFEPMYSLEPRQRPRLVPSPAEELDRLPPGPSPLFQEMLASRGLIDPPETPPRTPWR